MHLAFVCIKNQLLKHLEVWEDFEHLAVHSFVHSPPCAQNTAAVTVTYKHCMM